MLSDDPDAGRVEVSYLDVGKGQSVLVQSPDGNLLVDAGSTSTSKISYDGSLKKQLEENGVNTIDKLVLTHGHEDHVSYGEYLLEDFDVEEVYWNAKADSKTARNLERALEEADTAGELEFHSSVTSGDGDSLEPGSSVDVQVVHPDAPVGSDVDAESVALTVEAQEKRFHIASDARDPSNVKADGDVDVLTLQHHGAASTTE